jgi:protein involved in polysaccharide export with SLBB domain
MRKTITFTLLIALAAIRVPALDVTASLAKRLLDENEDRRVPAPNLESGGLDNSVDPARYMVGGGDAFQISIKGLPSQEYHAAVNSDGNLYIGDFGEISLGRISLAEAIRTIQEKVHAALGKRYRAYVALKSCKRPNVLVTGGVASPGTYSLSGTLRLLDALKAANGGILPSASEHDLRRIEVRNRDSVRSFDLLRFLAVMDLDQNPYVYPGDHVDLPRLDRSILVTGHVHGPFAGRVPVLPGETLGDLLPLLRYRSTADTSFLMVRRANEGTVRVALADAAGYELRDRDLVSIPSLEKVGTLDTVKVTGEASRKGTFPVSTGATTAAEVLELAGGATQKGDLERAVVIRTSRKIDPSSQSAAGPGNALAQQSGFSAPRTSAMSSRPEINSSLNDLIATNDFTVIRLGNDPSAVRLENGDELHIPAKDQFVYVSGQVRRPGAYAWREGKDGDWYVEQAGGYTRKADKGNRVVLARYKEVIQFKDPGLVERGDVIVVPASVENKKFSTVFLPLTQALISVMSLTISILYFLGQEK